MNLLVRSQVTTQDCNRSYDISFRTVPLSSSEHISALQIAQLNPGKAINNTFTNFREVATTSQGILLIAFFVGIAWIAWKKKRNNA